MFLVYTLVSERNPDLPTAFFEVAVTSRVFSGRCRNDQLNLN